MLLDKLGKSLTIIFWLIPPVVFIVFVGTFAQNLIVLDDYNMIGNPFAGYLKADSFSETIKVIFSQQNEYRFPILSSLSILQYNLFGEIKFNYYPIYGNLAVFGMCALVLYVFSRGRGYKKLLPIVYLMFPLHIYIIIAWANASCQYLPALCYSLLTMYLLAQDNKKLRNIAFLTGFLGAFSFGSGLFGILFGMAVLLIKKSYKFFFIWLVFSGVIFLVYFMDYRQTLSEGALNNLFYKTSDVILGFLYVWGGWSDLFYSSSKFWLNTVPMIAGIITAGLVIWVAIKALLVIIKDRTDVTAIFTLGAIGFLLFTTAVIAISRIGDNPEYTMLVSNHRYYSFIGLGIVYGWFVDKLSLLQRRIILTGIVAVYVLSIFRFTESASDRAKLLATEKFNHYKNGLHEKHQYYADYYVFQKSIDKALKESGAYVFPATEIHKNWDLINDFSLSENQNYSITYDQAESGMYLVEENAGGKVLDGTYYLLRSEDKMYAFYPKRKVLESRNPFALSNEFDVFILKLDLEEGVYELVICKYNDDVPTYFSTDIVWNVRHGS
jgi:hypothetical protein